MLKLTFLFVLFLSGTVFAQLDENHVSCSYCTSLEDALVEPSQVSYLNLSASGLTSIPTELNEFVNLKALDLGQNVIDQIDFSQLSLKQLEELNLSNNPGFDALNMEGISEALPNLKRLDLSQCRLIYLSKELAALKQLRELDVSKNSLKFIPSNLNQLTSLNASDNDLQDTYCLMDSWNLESLDISNSLQPGAQKVRESLKYKERLSELIISADTMTRKSLPSELSELPIRELTVKGGRIVDPNFIITKNNTIEKIVFDGVEVSDPKRLKDWINRFKSLDEVVYRNMTVPEYLDEIHSLETMRFENCDFQDKLELRSVRKTIEIKALRTDIRTEGYIGNSKLVALNTDVAENKSDYEISAEMRMNQLPPLVEPKTEAITLNSTVPNKITLEHSSFDIPSNAFLSKSGETYTGNVQVNITEYMDPVVNALAGVPMTYRTDEKDVIFSSSGMFEFRAYDESGNELNPNPDSPIQVEMSDLMPSQSSDLYRYNDSLNNWEILEEKPIEEGWMDEKARIMDSLNQISDVAITNFYVLPIATMFQYKKSRKDPYVVSFKTQGIRRRVQRQKTFKQIIRTENPDQKWIADQKWEIDTVMSEELASKFEELKKAQRKYKRFWNKGRLWRSRDAAPRFLKDLTITPDLERDNFRMNFTFKGEEISLPVSHVFSGSVRSVQAKEKRAYRDYERKKALTKRDNKQIEKYEQTVLKEQAEAIRERKVVYQMTNPSAPEIASERLRFGLNSPPNSFLERAGDIGNGLLAGVGTLLTFGLINVDTDISIPPKTIEMDAIAKDQHGKIVNVPPHVRTVFPRGGGYMSAPYYSVTVPRTSKPIVLFSINPNELAVVRSWKNLPKGKKQATIERINIAGLSPFEIRELIVSN